VEFFLKEASKYMKREKYPDFLELVKQPKEKRTVRSNYSLVASTLGAG
jgi:hypothetical protein